LKSLQKEVEQERRNIQREKASAANTPLLPAPPPPPPISSGVSDEEMNALQNQLNDALRDLSSAQALLREESTTRQEKEREVTSLQSAVKEIQV
jgi:hypothetical protein